MLIDPLCYARNNALLLAQSEVKQLHGIKCDAPKTRVLGLLWESEAGHDTPVVGWACVERIAENLF